MPRCRSKDGATVRVARRAASIWADVATIADIGELHLTSPAMDGPHVRSAQRALLHNPFGTFDPGPLDGVYGERTAAAVRRAKYWMGFPEQKIDQICTSELLGLLAEETPLPSSLKSMRTRRLKRAEDAQLWSAAYDAAVSCVGDRAVFDLDGDGVPDHIGMFARWLDAAETRYQTVEGNVSLSGEPNGGRVLQRERHRPQTFAFVHVRG